MSRYIIDADARQGITQPAPQRTARKSEYINADARQAAAEEALGRVF